MCPNASRQDKLGGGGSGLRVMPRDRMAPAKAARTTNSFKRRGGADDMGALEDEDGPLPDVSFSSSCSSCRFLLLVRIFVLLFILSPVFPIPFPILMLFLFFCFWFLSCSFVYSAPVVKVLAPPPPPPHPFI